MRALCNSLSEKLLYLGEQYGRGLTLLNKRISVGLLAVGKANAGEDHDANSGLYLLHRGGHFLPIHSRHCIIEKDQIDRTNRKKFQSFLGTASGFDAVSCILQIKAPTSERRFVVVNTKQGVLPGGHLLPYPTRTGQSRKTK